jgi:REP element-mobilizing transposase RayT
MNITLLEPGKYYHIYNRARNGHPLFEDDEACRFFLRLYKTHIVPVAETYAYCLLADHLHLLIRTRTDLERSLYKPFAILFNSYASGYNRHNGYEGRVFLYKLKRIEIRSPACFRDLVCYINQNPWKHGLTDHPGSYRFSSFRSTITTFPTLIERERLIDHFGCAENLSECLHSQVEEGRIKKLLLEE